MTGTGRLFKALSKRGPHAVLRGDLAFAGMSGSVYTPESGYNLPAVAFGHDWLTGTKKYHPTLEHLASWGIVAAAPDTENGLLPSHRNLAADLMTTLEIVTRVRLGEGKISVHPTKLALVGHGLGGSAAVLAATQPVGSDTKKSQPISAKVVVAIYPSAVKPQVEQSGKDLSIPGLVITSNEDGQSLRSNASALVQTWPSLSLRSIDKATSTGLPENTWLRRALGTGGSDRQTQRATQALLTGYLLFQLTGDKQYRDFGEATAELPGTSLPTVDEFHVEPVDRMQSLLR